MNTKQGIEVPIWEKFALTLPEASKYFNICESQLRKIVWANPNADYIVCNGKKYLLIRKKFEEYMTRNRILET
jgi:hypothetical protein